LPDNVYIQPLSLVPSPQAVAGDAIRLAGGMAFAHLIAVTVTRDGKVVQRELVTPSGIDWVFERLPDDIAPEAGRQWAGLRSVHAPLQLGARTIRLDQPQVMGILNVTPDSFSDGGKFLDDPAERNCTPRRCTRPGRRSSTSAGKARGRGLVRCGKATSSSGRSPRSSTAWRWARR
jgi:dihydropteroate synthase